MTNLRLFANGQPIILGSRIAKGGEGEVFPITNMPGFAVKKYLPRFVAKRENKIRSMVSIRLADVTSTVAFPYQVVVDGRGTFAGFVMRLVQKHKEIHELQTPSSRLQHFPKADYSFIVRVALNVAKVFARVHSTGCIVGDINQRGMLVSDLATVVLIDADSFQVSHNGQIHRCEVGVLEYTPPELQGKSLDTVRTSDHDGFGLAVCLFQLLCLDRHPFSGRFSGRGDMPLETAIKEYRFAYSVSRVTGMTPPPGSVRLEDLTPRIAQLFETAFSPSGVARRPSAAMWCEALGELEAALRVCSRNKIHRYSRHAKECPWCRMEAEYGRPVFFDADVSSIQLPSGQMDPSRGFALDVAFLLAVVNNYPIPQAISVSIPQVAGVTAPSAAALDAAKKKNAEPLTKLVAYGSFIGAVCSLALGAPGVLLAAGLGTFGGWLLANSSSATNELQAEHRRQVQLLTSHLVRLQQSSPIELVIKKKAEVLEAIDKFKSLTSAFGNVRTQYEKQRRQRQLDDHLAKFTIRGSRIPKLSQTDRAALASYGIATAFDAKRRDVQQVHGIGPIKASSIMGWVSKVEAAFQFQSAYTADDQRNIQKAQSDIVTEQQGIDDKLKRLIAEFKREVQSFERWKASRDPELLRLAQQYAQCEFDMRFVGLYPSRPVIPPALVPPISNFQRTSGGSNNTATASHGGSPVQIPSTGCPTCGSRMIRRVARRGRRRGRAFWGCSRYPNCTGIRPI
jgi:DNA-binding helix-hairpin-helix protein with protein kinase domain